MADLSIIENQLVQLSILVVTVIVGVITALRGGRSVSAAAADQPQSQVFPPEARYFFDGPIAKGLEYLQGCYRNSVELRNEAVRSRDDIRADLGEIIDLLRAPNGTVRRRRRARPRR